MSYLNRTQDPRRRATAVVAVATVHAVLAVVLLKGLDVDFVRMAATPFIGEQIPLPPPPPPEPTPPKPEVPTVRTQTDPPPIPFPPTPGPRPEVSDDPGPIGGPILDPFPPSPPLPPPRPSPSFTPRHAVPRNGTSGWISTDDYPRQPLVNGIEGSVAYRLVIGTNGRVASCELTRPSGNRALDDATCRLISNRARFEAATDEAGARVLGTYTGTVTWQIPD